MRPSDTRQDITVLNWESVTFKCNFTASPAAELSVHDLLTAVEPEKKPENLYFSSSADVYPLGTTAVRNHEQFQKPTVCLANVSIDVHAPEIQTDQQQSDSWSQSKHFWKSLPGDL